MSTFLIKIVRADYSNLQGARPPGLENLDTIVTWALWGAGFILFLFFIGGLVAAARARKKNAEVDAEAPAWPLILAIILGASGAIWNAIAP
ncbi:hypothetical protein [Lysinibacter sp. HNR]|uniref:hypothetical protein n=1 Tax=Lysinibacter sp. HNR TaxID=3031408 RepID=UPI002434C014|nr:hypothetical protein [Lysinibacter sp. HNR]WGD37578.1 hypothetical protein FrondiHNR_01240 [Lysinibacter sp. HNR]